MKAILLVRQTGAPARSTMSVFMERNVGLFALLTIATAAAFVAPPVAVRGFNLLQLTLLVFAAYVAANIVLASRPAYRLVDYLVALTPLGYPAEVPKDRDVVLYCRSGRRTEIAGQVLTGNGYTRLQHLEGDIIAWVEKGRPVEKPRDAAACLEALKAGRPAQQACAAN